MDTFAPTSSEAEQTPRGKSQRIVLKIAAVLWFIWGLFHVAVGIAIVAFLRAEHPGGELAAIPGTLDVDFFGNESTFASIATMQQHGFNLAWIGVIVTIASIFVWRAKPLAVATSALIGGLADLGYFVFFDLAGYAEPPGPQMTYIMAMAIGLAGIAYFSTNWFKDLGAQL